MAQAARLNLRMQKELKILLTDPPPGATFPSLSPQSDASSSSTATLTSIDAQIEGPEGTVYDKGVFKLKIQIPERYPFQPPIVMFATPIYHPNIDNGGRICLDILNLPPKGAWQPSLNISTVLTSIGLLLSEPNPDDGLMQEASREYKYNRQAFDQKARSMTEKYARAGSVEMARGEQERETPSELNKDLTENMESTISKESVCEYSISHKRLHGVGKKLSLEASESGQRRVDGKEDNNNFDLPTKKKVKGLLKESKLTPAEHNQTYKNLQCTKRKLQLGCKPVENCDNLIEGKPDQYSPLSEPQAVSEHSFKCLSAGQSDSGPLQNLCGSEDNLATSKSIAKDEHLVQITAKDDNKLCAASQSYLIKAVAQPVAARLPEKICVRAAEEHRNSLTSIRHKKLGLAGRRLPLEKSSNQSFKSNDKENLAPRSSILLPTHKENFDLLFSLSEKSDAGLCFDVSMQKATTHSIDNSTVTGQRRPSNSSGHCSNEQQSNIELERQSECSFQALKHTFHCKSRNEKELQTKECNEKFVGSIENQEQATSDSVVVLDSEESDDEKVINARSKLSLARRRLPGKRKS